MSLDVPIVDPEQSSKVVVPIIRYSEIQFSTPPIGKGAFGQVFKGKCRGMDVAVKVLDDIEWSDDVVNEFVAEVTIMARLHHPNILICMGACTEVAFGQNTYAIVMEYMLRGDLHHILHNKPEVSLTFTQQIQFAIDIAKGMAWLTGQKILHRDLKPANILVDNNWTCKIADFGLSQIQLRKQKKRDQDEAPGSVLWMAPEVLLKEEIDFKLDVYAFTLVFWEILTRKFLFSEYNDRDIFTEHIARRGERPPLDDIHPVLQQILKQGWHHYPSQRPTFEALLKMIQNAIVYIHLPEELCPMAHKFWAKEFPGITHVDSDTFVRKLYLALGKKMVLNPQLACLKELICGGKQVSIVQFGMLLKWFGKMKGTKDILERVEEVMHYPWFFGTESASSSSTKLEDHPVGTFLVRLNSHEQTIDKAPFTISRVGVDGISNRQVVIHTRVYLFEKDTGFVIKIGNDRKIWSSGGSSIVDYINHLKECEPQLCGNVCPGWPFGSLFENKHISVYQEDDDL